jgi:hypothetical protein
MCTLIRDAPVIHLAGYPANPKAGYPVRPDYNGYSAGFSAQNLNVILNKK